MALYLFFVILMAVLIFLSKGLDPRAVQVWLGLSAVLAVPCYFMARSKHDASNAERFLAKAWLLFRRIVCFTAATLFAAGGVFAALSPKLEHRWAGAFLMSLLSFFFTWWGAFGAGESRAFGDDVPLHEARKKRYGWK